MAAEHRPGRADDQAAAGQDLEQIADPVRAGVQVVDGHDATDLAEQPGALRRGRLDGLIADIEPFHQVLQQIPDPIPVRPKVDAAGGKTAMVRSSVVLPYPQAA